MDPLDHARPGLGDTTCAVCDGPVPAGAVHLLARRDDLAFVQVECAACRSTTLAFVLASSAAPASERGPVTVDDVLDMHSLLRGWQGGLRDLLGAGSSQSGPAS